MSITYTVNNVKYLKVNEKNHDIYWKELGLNIDFLKETKLKDVNKSFELEIQHLKKSDLLEVSEFLIGKNEATDSADKIFASDISTETKTLFLLLREFTLRKKKSIQEYVQYTKDSLDYSSEIALVWSLYTEGPHLLFEITTYHHWRNRSSDKLYTFSKKQTEIKVLKIAKEAGSRDALCNKLYKASGEANNYRIYSFCNTKKAVIFHLYKMINDKTVADFEQPVRNREVKSVMFSVDLEQKHVEIRDYTAKEKKELLEYLSDKFESQLEEVVPEPYAAFESKTLKKSFLGIDVKEDHVKFDDLMISAITFHRSILPKSPLIHFELENEDIMEAVFQAYHAGVIDLKDLKDIKSLKLRTSSVSRLIRAIPLNSGDVIFAIDDSNLAKETKGLFEQKFKEKFGIPLNQPITNVYFEKGLEEKVDYLMGLSRKGFFDQTTMEKFDELIDEKLITKNTVVEKYCPVCKEEFPEEAVTCSECEVGLKQRSSESFEVNRKNAFNFFEKKITGLLSSPWTEIRRSTITIEKENEQEKGKAKKKEKEKYHFLVLTNDKNGNEIRFLLTTEQLTKKTVNRIQRMVIPTIIVYIGSNAINIDKHNDNNIMTKNFGYFYVMKKSEQLIDYLNEADKEFAKRKKQSSAKSGLEAFRTIKNWLENGEDYTDKEFEHDVYAMINDFAQNIVQWGAKYSGRILPEGAFTLSYRVNGDIGKNAYSYDCKLTGRDKGYPLDISEHRKAAQYLRILSQSDFLKDYLNGSNITAHLIISNKVEIKKITAMNDYLKIDGINSRVKLIKIETLLRIYELYTVNYDTISAKPNYFKKMMAELINKDCDELKKSDVEKKFERLLESGLMEQTPLNMRRLTEDVLDSTDLEELQIKN